MLGSEISDVHREGNTLLAQGRVRRADASAYAIALGPVGQDGLSVTVSLPASRAGTVAGRPESVADNAIKSPPAVTVESKYAR